MPTRSTPTGTLLGSGPVQQRRPGAPPSTSSMLDNRRGRTGNSTRRRGGVVITWVSGRFSSSQTQPISSTGPESSTACRSVAQALGCRSWLPRGSTPSTLLPVPGHSTRAGSMWVREVGSAALGLAFVMAIEMGDPRRARAACRAVLRCRRLAPLGDRRSVHAPRRRVAGERAGVTADAAAADRSRRSCPPRMP